MDSSCNEPLIGVSAVSRFARPPAWKRAIDIAGSLAAMPVLGLFTLVMTVVTRITSPGPVFFRQKRIGHRGMPFMCYKFRTMIVGADSSVHQTHCDYLIQSNAPMAKMDARGDSRLIPGGWLLRASGLDELPQIINVLRGEMSLVGPRPCVPYEYDKYLSWQRERFAAVPGLTGLWQVSGKNRTTFEEMIRLDIRYARNQSWWLDLKIMFLTIPALLIQISDTRRGRKSSVQTDETAAAIRARNSSQWPAAGNFATIHTKDSLYPEDVS
jgi:lipopolysaccharide/colanic/teichoic acid biosynthesis glycosyltransferase